MQEIDASLIEKAVYNLCKEANIRLPLNVYNKIRSASQENEQNQFILKNAQIAFERQRPLCQDTGQVIVFADIGQNVHICGDNITDAINKGVSKCYKDNFYRKSIVKNALYDRNNSQDNTPAVIHYNIIDADYINIKIMIKGGGSENVTGTKMLNPTLTNEQIYKEIMDIIKAAGKNACPPLFIGIGFGQTAENAILLSKKAILEGKENSQLCKFLNENIDIGLKTPILDVKELSSSTHIASMPLGITIMCHSNRYHSCVIRNNKIEYTTELSVPETTTVHFEGKKLYCNDIEGLKSISSGEKILLNGKVYTARDQAHKRLVKMIKNGETLPIDIKNTILFYAGPCPSTPNEISGPIGPTTSKRMDAFAIELYESGIIATIGKGTRSESILKYLEQSNKKYFEMQGGIASYIASCIKSCKITAFEDLGAEAIYELEVENLPVICVI